MTPLNSDLAKLLIVIILLGKVIQQLHAMLKQNKQREEITAISDITLIGIILDSEGTIAISRITTIIGEDIINKLI